MYLLFQCLFIFDYCFILYCLILFIFYLYLFNVCIQLYSINLLHGECKKLATNDYGSNPLWVEPTMWQKSLQNDPTMWQKSLQNDPISCHGHVHSHYLILFMIWFDGFWDKLNLICTGTLVTDCSCICKEFIHSLVCSLICLLYFSYSFYFFILFSLLFIILFSLFFIIVLFYIVLSCLFFYYICSMSAFNSNPLTCYMESVRN